MADQYNVKLNMEYASVKAMNDELRKSKDELVKIVSVGGDATDAMKRYANVKNDIAQFNNVLRQTAVTTQQTTTASANAGMALLNLNYVIRDSPYFFQNFALGVLAVGNNLNPLIDSFNRLRVEAVEKNISTLALLRQALVGGAGISIAFSAVVTAIQAFVFWQSKAKKETTELKDEIGKLIVEYQKYIEVQKELTSDPSAMGTIFGGTEGYYKAKQEIYDYNQATKEFIDTAEERLKEQRKIYREILGSYAPGSPMFNTVKSWIAEIDKLLAGYDIDNKEKKVKDRGSIWASLMKLDTKDFAFMNEQQKKVFDQIKENFERQGIRWDGTAQAFALDIVMRIAEKYPMAGKVRTRQNPMEETIRSIQEELKPIFATITEIATVAGNAISNAFLSGKNAIDAAAQAVKQFIVQLLVVQTLKGIVGTFFGLPFIEGFTYGLIPGLNKTASPPAGSMRGNNAVRVVGKITADKNNFIANIRNADNYYKRNEEFVLVGR